MAWVLGSMCAAGLTDRRHVDALLSCITQAAPTELLSGVMRGWELLGDDDVAPVVCEDVVAVVYGVMGKGRTCDDAPINLLARFMEMQRRGTDHAAGGAGHGLPVTHTRVKEQVEGLVDAVMEDEQGVGVEVAIGAVMSMTLLPPATLVDNLEAACDAVGEVDEANAGEGGDKAAADRLATRIGDRLATLPPSYLPDKLDPLIDLLKLPEPDEQDGNMLVIVDGAVRILQRLPMHLFDALADRVVRAMLYNNEWTVEACARVLTGRAEYTHLRMAARISGVMEEHGLHCRAMVISEMTGLRHALCVALPREVTVLLSHTFLKYMFEDDARDLHQNVMGDILERLEPEEVLPYADQLVECKDAERMASHSHSAPGWRAPLLAKLPFTALEAHFSFLLGYMCCNTHTYDTYILPIYRHFPPSHFGPEVDHWFNRVGPSTRSYLWRENPRPSLPAVYMARAMDLCEGATLSASTVRVAAALSCVMHYDPQLQLKGWQFHRDLDPGVIPPDFESLLLSLPAQPQVEYDPHDTYPLTDDAKDARNALRLHLHERAEVLKSPYGCAKINAALASDNADHRLVVLQFFQCMPVFAAGLVVDHVAPMVAVRLEDPDARVRCAVLKVLRRVSSGARAPLAHNLCRLLLDDDHEIRELTHEVLFQVPPAALAPLAAWAVDRLVAPGGQPWAACVSLKRLIWTVVSNGVGLHAHVKPHIPRLLECAMDESTSVDTSDACMDALSRVPPSLWDDFPGVVQKLINGNTRLQPAAMRLVQQWEFNDIGLYEDFICSTLNVDDIECRVAMLPMFERLPGIRKIESADRAVDAVVRHHSDPHLAEAVGRLIGRSEQGCDAVVHAVHCLLERVAQSDLCVRHAALGVLQHLPGAHFTRQQTLLAQLLSSPSRDVVLSTLDLIIDRMSHTYLPLLTAPLMRLLRRVQDPRVCQAAAKALASRTAGCLTPHAEEVVGVFVEAGTVATDALRTKEAAQVHSVFVPHLKVLLADDSVDTRRKALVALTYINGTLLAPLKPDLEARLTDASFSVRDLAVRLLGNVGQGYPVHRDPPPRRFL